MAEAKEIKIKSFETGAFEVSSGDRSTGELDFGEMLCVVISLAIGDRKPGLQWLKTKEQIEAYEKHIQSIKDGRG